MFSCKDKKARLARAFLLFKGPLMVVVHRVSKSIQTF